VIPDAKKLKFALEEAKNPCEKVGLLSATLHSLMVAIGPSAERTFKYCLEPRPGSTFSQDTGISIRALLDTVKNETGTSYFKELEHPKSLQLPVYSTYECSSFQQEQMALDIARTFRSAECFVKRLDQGEAR